MLHDRREVIHFTPALVVGAFALADAAEIRSPGLVAELNKGARKRLHHLVVERSAELRMRVGDEGVAASFALRRVDCAFDAARRPGDELAARAGAHYIRRRSTMRPCLRCSSMISSISARST